MKKKELPAYVRLNEVEGGTWRPGPGAVTVTVMAVPEVKAAFRAVAIATARVVGVYQPGGMTTFWVK
jgi:hypothetical protein